MRGVEDVVRWLRYDTEWNDIASQDKADDAIATLERARAVIDAALLVQLVWMGDGVDGGKAMREALLVLNGALERYENLSQKRETKP